jgi:hypothetical protein
MKKEKRVRAQSSTAKSNNQTPNQAEQFRSQSGLVMRTLDKEISLWADGEEMKDRLLNLRQQILYLVTLGQGQPAPAAPANRGHNLLDFCPLEVAVNKAAGFLDLLAWRYDQCLDQLGDIHKGAIGSGVTGIAHEVNTALFSAFNGVFEQYRDGRRQA